MAASLEQLLTDSGRCLPIADAVNALTKLKTEAYILANLHILRLLEARHPLPALDQTFFYRCLCAVADGNAGDAAIEVSRALYCTCRPPGYRTASRSALRGMLQNCSQQMATAAKNHVSTNLYKRMQRHCRLRFHMDGAEVYSLLEKIFSGEMKPFANPVVQHFQELMPIPTQRALESTPHLFMRVLWEMERFNQRHADMKNVRGFSLLPLAGGFTAGYIKVCSTGLRALLAAAEKPVPSEKDFLQPAVRAEFWRECFRIDKVETANRRFADEHSNRRQGG